MAGLAFGQMSTNIQYENIQAPNRLMIQEQRGGLTFTGDIAKEREQERVMNQLRAEFDKIDINGDGNITCNEIVEFLL